jgi:uncharacterized protein (TIGR02611 family)
LNRRSQNFFSPLSSNRLLVSGLLWFSLGISLSPLDRLGRNWSRYRSDRHVPEGFVSHKSTESSTSQQEASSDLPEDSSDTVRRARKHGRLHRRLHANPALSATTKVVITTVGSLVVVAGLVMMVTPGPGIVGIVLGLAILSTEYEWADRWLAKARQKAHEARVRAENMDPRVRRRRLLLAGVGFLAVAAAVIVYVAVFGWPGAAVDGWDWLQGMATWVPELPGM